MYNVYECAYYVHVGILLKWLCSNARLLPLTIMTNDGPHIIWKKFDSSNYQKEEEIRSP